MAYRYEKNNNGEFDLVIDGWENGIASSPFKGIGNIKNLNIKYYDGVAYVNYKRQACTMTGGTLANPIYATQSPAGIIYIADDNRQIWKQDAVNGSSFTKLTGNANQPINGMQFWNNYLLVLGGDVNGKFEICGDGTGDAGVTSANWNTAGAATGVWPMNNTVTMTLTGTPLAGSTSATISSYLDAQGTSRAFWNGPTGFYNMTFQGQTQVVVANLTQGSAAITWTPELNAAPSGASAFPFINGSAVSTTGISHMSLISSNDGDLYFCNGSNIGAFKLNPNQVFTKGDMKTFTFYANILGLPPTETTTWLTELRNQLIILGKYRMYQWDFSSIYWGQPVPLDEALVKGINILNKLYIFAGNKGNIYLSDGYSFSRFVKIPDYISGAVDPAWYIGGVMQHRQKLYFQATAKNSQSGATIFQGIFSIDLDTGAINMENQNSGGLTPAGLITGGLLIDDNSTAINYDKYYSAYGATAPSVDFNDTTLYSNNEAIIETDIIPIGTFYQLKTFRNAEFKLDQPMKSGDSITLEARQSLSDNWTTIGTTTTAVLSDGFAPLTFEKWQWAQFRIKMSCNATATASSFNRLREIRIR